MPIRIAFLLCTLCLVVFPSSTLQAQEALNALLPQAPIQAKAGHVVVPDTTTPWRYFPLAVGNAWEYQDFRGFVVRTSIVRDTTFDGHRYFRLDEVGYGQGPDFAEHSRLVAYVRYDTTEQRVRWNAPNFDDESVFFYTPCSFASPFNEVADCTPQSSWYVGGGYDGMLVFGGEQPGEGSDTLRTSVKTFILLGREYRHAAGFGLVYHEVEGHGWGLVYAKIGGVEYGKRRITVAREPDVFAASGIRIERRYPNPAHAQFRLDYTAVQAGSLTISLFDALGRRVAEDTVMGASSSGTVPLDVSVLAPGTYFARLCMDTACTTRSFVKAR